MAAPAAPDYEIIRDEAGLAAIAGEWDELWRHAANPSPFLHIDWVTMCWRRVTLTAPRAPLVVIVREDGNAVLAAPLMAEQSLGVLRAYGGLRSALPQYNDVLLAASGNPAPWIAALLSALGLDRLALRLRLDRLPSWSPATTSLHEHAASQRRLLQGAVIDFSGGYEAYLQAFSRPTRAQLRRQLRQLGEHGLVRLRHADRSSFNADFDWLLAQKRAWTPPAGRPLRRWLRSASAETDLRFLTRGWIGMHRAELAILETGGRRIAAALSFIGGNAEAIYFAITYDPAFGHYSPGRILTLMVIDSLAARGITRLDLMSGGAQWKERLATGTPPILKVRTRLLR